MAFVERFDALTAARIAPQTKHDRMRLILMFEDLHIVNAYKMTQIPLKRPGLDARNSESHRQATFEGRAITKFNDPTWIPKSQALPSLHEDFKEQVEYPLRAGKSDRLYSIEESTNS